MDKLTRIKKLLEDRNCAEVARRNNITPTYLNYIKNGKREPSEELQTKLLNYLEGKQNG